MKLNKENSHDKIWTSGHNGNGSPGADSIIPACNK